jgi:hypothetical protein
MLPSKKTAGKMIRRNISWRLFISSSCLILAGRILTDCLFFDCSGEQKLISEFPMRFNIYFRKNTSVVLITNHSNSSLGLSEITVPSYAAPKAPCVDEDTFQYNTSFARGEMPKNIYNESVKNALDCCKQCEQVDRCTHWSFSTHAKQCTLKSSPTNVLKSPRTVAGRVSLNKYLERRSVSIGRLRYTCDWDPEDRPFFQHPSTRNKHEIIAAPNFTTSNESYPRLPSRTNPHSPRTLGLSPAPPPAPRTHPPLRYYCSAISTRPPGHLTTAPCRPQPRAGTGIPVSRVTPAPPRAGR